MAAPFHPLNTGRLSRGKTHSFGGRYAELVPNARIRITDAFDDPNLPGGW